VEVKTLTPLIKIAEKIEVTARWLMCAFTKENPIQRNGNRFPIRSRSVVETLSVTQGGH
jgi:hypothetical protein